jgi:hypothetical protein
MDESPGGGQSIARDVVLGLEELYLFPNNAIHLGNASKLVQIL